MVNDHYPYEKWLAIIGNINPTFSGPNPYTSVIKDGHWTWCLKSSMICSNKNMVRLFTATIFTWWTNSLLLKMAIEIVDLPIENGDFPYKPPFSHAFPMIFPWFTWNMLKWMVFCWANIVPRKTSRVFAHDNRQLQGSGWWLTYPSEKWWSESQLGWWNSQLNGTMKFMFQTTSQICTLIR